ncbi:MAG: hypothetical protein DRG82_16565, partial [Deltaproteobacteria bacterium]
GEEANIIFGAAIDESMNGQVRVTVIATGFGDKDQQASVAKGFHEREKSKILEFEKAINDDLTPSGQVTSSSIGTGTQTAVKSKGGTIATPTKPYPLTMDELEIPTFIRRQID